MSKNLIFSACATCGLLLLTGCSLFEGDSRRDEQTRNVAYSVPESVSKNSGVERRKPTRPSWSEDASGLESRRPNKSAVSSEGEVYVVMRGDTIYSIARRFGFSPQTLMQLNGMDRSSKLYVGQTIKLPGKAQGSLECISASSEGGVYVAMRGDTMYSIARRFGVSPQTLMDLNGMDRSSKLHVGQTIRLPGKAQGNPACEATKVVVKDSPKKANTIRYVVGQGDSLSKIARMHSMKVAELKELNGLSDDFIRVGQELDVYKPKNPIVDTRVVNAKKYVLDADGFYTIEQGDSLDKIARNFGISSKALKEANGIDDPLKLQIGKKLIIPPNGKGVVAGHSSSTVPAQQGNFSAIPQRVGEGSGASGTIKSGADSDDFFETFDNIKVFDVEN